MSSTPFNSKPRLNVNLFKCVQLNGGVERGIDGSEEKAMYTRAYRRYRAGRPYRLVDRCRYLMSDSTDDRWKSQPVF